MCMCISPVSRYNSFGEPYDVLSNKYDIPPEYQRYVSLKASHDELNRLPQPFCTRIKKAILNINKDYVFNPRNGIEDEQQLFYMQLELEVRPDYRSLSHCLMMAIEKHNPKTAQYLIEQRADIFVKLSFMDKNENTITSTPIQRAIDVNFDKFVFHILKNEKPENYKNYNYRGLLLMANRWNKDLLEFLFSNNIGLNSKDGSGREPLSKILDSLRAFEIHKDLIPRLLKSGASTAAHSIYGVTPLMYAISKTRPIETITLILNYINDLETLNIKDLDGKTALDYAKERKNIETEKLILDKEKSLSS